MNTQGTIGWAKLTVPSPRLRGRSCSGAAMGRPSPHSPIDLAPDPLPIRWGRVRLRENQGSTPEGSRISKRLFAKLVALLSGLLVLPLALPGAETAQARLFCLSLQFQQGT